MIEALSWISSSATASAFIIFPVPFLPLVVLSQKQLSFFKLNPLKVCHLTAWIPKYLSDKYATEQQYL